MVNDNINLKKDENKNKHKNRKKDKQNKKIPKEISQEILKKIFKNILKAVIIVLYFITLNLAYTAIKQERLVKDIEVFSGVFLLLGLFFLEKAYKKDNGTYAIDGIEFLVISLHSLTIMHFITVYKYDFRLYLLTSSYIFAIYYVLKAIILYTKERREYLQSLSDIPEIVKKDKPIKKEAKKRDKLENEQELIKETKIEKNERNQTIDNLKKKKRKTTQTKTKAKTATTNKKTAKKEDEISEKETKEKKVSATKKTTKKGTKKATTESKKTSTTKKVTKEGNKKPKTRKTTAKKTSTEN